MLSREQSREIDRHAIEVLGIPGIVLMENAGRGCAEVLWEQSFDLERLAEQTLPGPLAFGQINPSNQAVAGTGMAVVICCGPGNNGGDGFVIARHLWLAGIKVKVILVSARKHYRGDALTNLRILENLHLELVDCLPDWSLEQWLDQLSTAGGNTTTWVVDALLGTGARGELSGQIRRAVEAINRCPAKRLAVDLPTGLDCDTGQTGEIAVRADITCTFVAPKVGFSHASAAMFLGEVLVIGIGTAFDSA